MSLMSCQPGNIKSYEVKRAGQAVQITGKGTDPGWEMANELTDFSFPWRADDPPATSFRALWDQDFLYFLYRAEDTEIVSKQEGLGERDVVESDRVEIFFKSDDKMTPYYALELDALGRVLDNKANYYRNFDKTWNWPEGHLQLKASVDATGYWVEGAISLESLRNLGVYQDDYQLKAGLFRGEYRHLAPGEVEVRWISWILPDSETPDFHIPSAFGILQLEQ